MTRNVLLMAGSLLVLAACSDSSNDPAEQIYASALAQWNQLGPASYDLVIRRQCVVCTVTDVNVTIQVRNRAVTARFYTELGDNVTEPNAAALYPDVPGLFQVVRNAMNQDPLYLSAEYDQTYGHPVLIQLDLDGGRSDDNVVYTTLSLTPVE